MPMSPRLLRPRQAGGFNPRQISGLMAWWDFSDTATLGPTSSGPGTVSDNGPVKYVADKSGNGRHMIQTGADSVSPTLLAASLNGKSTLGFDGGDSLTCSSTVTLTGQTVFQILRRGSSAISFARAFSQSDAGADFSSTGHYIPVLRSSDGNGLSSYASSTFRATLTVPAGAWLLFSSRHSGSEISNNVNNGAAATFSHTLNKQFSQFAIGDGVNATAPWQDRIAETVVYSRALSDAERNTVARYLGLKWGITVS